MMFFERVRYELGTEIVLTRIIGFLTTKSLCGELQSPHRLSIKIHQMN